MSDQGHDYVENDQRPIPLWRVKQLIAESEERTAVVITDRFDKQDREYSARSKVDDARYAKSTNQREEMLARMDGHGKRTTALETKWTAFFSDEGAFKIFVTKLESQEAGQRTVQRMIGGLIVLQAVGIPLLLLYFNAKK